VLEGGGPLAAALRTGLLRHERLRADCVDTWFHRSPPAGVPRDEKRRLPPAWRESGRGAGPELLVPTASRSRIGTRTPRHG